MEARYRCLGPHQNQRDPHVGKFGVSKTGNTGLRALFFLLKRLHTCQDFEHGTTEIMNLASLASRLRELFVTLQESATTPIILLVHDQDVTRSVLQCAGVDISQCQIGIQSLLYYQEPEVSR